MTAKTKKPEKKKTSSEISTRGRTFQGVITKKFPTRVVIEFDRTVYIKKYERFSRQNTRIHARIPQGMHLDVGQTVRARECRPLSKIIHFVVTDIVKEAEA